MDLTLRYIERSLLVVPNDSADLVDTLDNNKPIKTRSVMLGSAGDLSFMDDSGVVRTIQNLAVGIMHPIGTKRIMATGTTSTQVYVMW